MMRISVLFVLLFGSHIGSLFGQVATSFENATGQNLNSSCRYTDPDNTTTHVLQNFNDPDCGVIVVQETGSGALLGYEITFTPTGGTGFSDGDLFGVATSAAVNQEVGVMPPDGSQAFLMEDTDGLVSMAFNQVDLTSTTNPTFSMQYALGATSWETADVLFIRIEITDCVAATTVTLQDTRGLDIDDLMIEGMWNTLSTNLSTYIGCKAQLIIDYNVEAAAEEAAFDVINFSEGSQLFPLPVVFTTFEGKDTPNSIRLDWTTELEESNDYFEVLKSTDGRDFWSIGKVTGAGNSDQLLQYDFVDNNPINGANYYQLKQVDYDGSFQYSTIIRVNHQSASNGGLVTVSPNPLAERLSLQVSETLYEGSTTQPINVHIYDLKGQLIRDLGNLQSVVNPNWDVSTLPSGVYWLRMIGGPEVFPPIKMLKL